MGIENFGNIDANGTREPISIPGVFVANHRKIANISHIYIDDGGVFSGNKVYSSSYALFPAIPAVNDAIYFGIDTTLADSGPFSSLVFDIGFPAVYQGTAAIAWEMYGGGTWNSITVVDDTTDTAGKSFMNTGIGAIAWDIEAYSMAPFTEPTTGVTAYWIRCRVTNVGTGIQAPAQHNRKIYTCSWSYAEIQASEIEGDIQAILTHKVRRVRENISVPTRVIIGQRQVSRGENFVECINFAQSQNPSGITVVDTGANSTFTTNVNTNVGEYIVTTFGVTSTLEITVTLDSTIAKDFVGKFRVFIRTACDIFAAPGKNEYILKYTVGSQGQTITNSPGYLTGLGSGPVGVSITDLGVVNIAPVSPHTVLDEITFEIWAKTLANTNVYFYDLWLMPVDERVIEIHRQSSVSTSNGEVIVDAIEQPKRVFAYSEEGGALVSFHNIYGKSMLNIDPRSRVRLYYLIHGNPNADGTAGVDLCDISFVRLEAVQQYLSMRGDR